MNEDNSTTIKCMEIIKNESFDYDGYQVVRGEFFAHLYEPIFIFHNNRVSVNSACIKRLAETEYIQILVNPDKKQLAVLPCNESDKDSFKWCTGTKKRLPRKITCPIFTAKVYDLMGWSHGYKYKLLGKLIDTGQQLIFIFDLSTPEIFIPKDGGNRMSKNATYPAEWQNQFGIPVSSHRNTLDISIFNGCAVFSINCKNKETINEQ